MLPLVLDASSLVTLNWLLLIALAVCCGLLLDGLIFATGRCPRWQFSQRWRMPLLLGLLCFEAIVWQLCLLSELHDRVDGAWLLAMVVGVLFWSQLRVKDCRDIGQDITSPDTTSRRLSPYASPLADCAGRTGKLIAPSLGARTARLWLPGLHLIALTIASHSIAIGDGNLNPLVTVPGALTSHTTAYALTDAGQRIELYQRQLQSDEFEDFIQKSRNQVSSLVKHAMLRAAPSVQANCHGWVFTEGKHILRNESVPVILEQNRYQVTAQPSIGDVVVYRDENGQVIHTGLVCGQAELGGNQVLVQSKWGIDGLYVHLVDEQPYSSRYAFYRSSRQGHSLRIQSVSTDSQLPDPAELAMELASIPSPPNLLQ